MLTDNKIAVQYHKINASSYQDVWDFQFLLSEDIKNAKKIGSTNEIVNHLILCEHDPVYTLGKSADKTNMLASAEELERQGAESFTINRGGDVTYHGPGQITGYLIMDLELLYRDLHRYIRDIEEIIIKTVASYGIEGVRNDGYTGVWVEDNLGKRKICAIGVHMSRWVSMHGFALNVNTDLSRFNAIVPCGIRDGDRSVTSISKELHKKVSLNEVSKNLIDKCAEAFGMEITRL